MIHSEIISLDSRTRCHWIDITLEVTCAIRRSSIRNGIVVVTSLHTTASVTINENGDPDVEKDFFHKLSLIAPHQEPFYLHAEGNSDSHLKTSLVGTDITRSLIDGKMQLGTWQSIYFCEFDGPRSNRRFSVTIMGD